jgi:tetratricopeptide (TPR) repeat protein
LAFVNQARGFRDFLPRRQAYRRAREFIAKALEADPNFATAYGRLGEIAGAEGDLQVAAEEVRRALTIEPKNTIVLAMASSLLVSLNRNPEAIAVSEYLLVNDPVNPIRLANTADSYVAVGRYADAIATCKTVLTLTPGRPSAQSHLVAALLLSGRGEEAREVIKEVKNEDVRREMNAMVEHLLGRKPQSDAGLASLISDYAKKTDDDDRADAAFRIARVLAFRGDSERAFEWLAKLEAAPSSTTSLAYDPYLKGLHDDPRWLALLRRLGRAPEQLAEIEFKVTLPQAVAEPQSNTSQQAR